MLIAGTKPDMRHFQAFTKCCSSFVWTLAVLTLVAEKKYGVKVIGTVTMPVAIVGVVFDAIACAPKCIPWCPPLQRLA